jgi:hypothetical protein
MSDARLEPAAVPGLQADPSDEELLAGLAAGRLEALDALYERYKSRAYGIARRITADDVLAEDVVQDAFLGAWRSADRYAAGRGSVKTWLLSIVHHRAIDAVRRRRPTAELPVEGEGQATPAALTLPDVWGEVSGRSSWPRWPACLMRSARPSSSPTGAGCPRPRSPTASACPWAP